MQEDNVVYVTAFDVICMDFKRLWQRIAHKSSSKPIKTQMPRIVKFVIIQKRLYVFK
jgi:hypothetical protein